MILKIWKIFLITAVISHLSFADDVLHLNKGELAPYEGFLFTVPKTQDIKNTYLERDTFNLINESQQKSLVLLSNNNNLLIDKNKILEDQNNNLAKSLYETRQSNTLEKMLWFSLGVVSVGLAVYAGKKTLNQ